MQHAQGVIPGQVARGTYRSVRHRPAGQDPGFCASQHRSLAACLRRSRLRRKGGGMAGPKSPWHWTPEAFWRCALASLGGARWLLCVGAFRVHLCGGWTFLPFGADASPPPLPPLPMSSGSISASRPTVGASPTSAAAPETTPQITQHHSNNSNCSNSNRNSNGDRSSSPRRQDGPTPTRASPWHGPPPLLGARRRH